MTPAPSTALARPQENMGVITGSLLADMKKLAVEVFTSGLMPIKFKNPEQMVVAALHGREIGLTFMQSLKEVHVINGVPGLSAMVVLAKMRVFAEAGGGYVNITEQTKDRCAIECKRSATAQVKTYTWEMFECPSTLRNKDNWKNHPVDMLTARCITRAGRGEFSDVLLGFGYTADELIDTQILKDEGGTHAAQAGGSVPPVPKRQPAPAQAQGEEPTIIDERPTPPAGPLDTAPEAQPETPAAEEEAKVNEQAIMNLQAALLESINDNEMELHYGRFTEQNADDELTLVEGYRTYFNAKRDLEQRTAPKN